MVAVVAVVALVVQAISCGVVAALVVDVKGAGDAILCTGCEEETRATVCWSDLLIDH